MRPKNEKLQNI